MCRSIKTLREPYVETATEDDVRAAALQYVRKVSGYRSPATKNAAAFERAVEAVAASTRSLLDDLQVARSAVAASDRPRSGRRPQPARTP